MLLVDLLDVAMLQNLKATEDYLQANHVHYFKHFFENGTIISTRLTGVLPGFEDISLYFDKSGKFLSTVEPQE